MVTENGSVRVIECVLQHLLAIANMPPNAGIPQQPRRQRPAAHGKQQNDENQIGDGGSKKSKPRRGGV